MYPRVFIMNALLPLYILYIVILVCLACLARMGILICVSGAWVETDFWP